jgi:N-methylhydantoinase B/oxoprolinase/acetone carboxylase alpha subunit
MRLWDCIVAALAQTKAPELIAATYGTCFGFAGTASDPNPARRGSFIFFLEGGWGASAVRDGWSAVPNQTSNFKDYPVEILENQLPLLAESVAYRRDSAGPGQNRGGFGVKRSLRVLSESLTLACEADRFETGAFGLFGGGPGLPSAALVESAGTPGAVSFQERFGLVSASKFCDVELRAGDRFTLLTGGGGGFGDPFDRPADLVRLDVVQDLISVEHARIAYGVVLARKNGQLVVDAAATEAERASRRSGARTTAHIGLDEEARRRLAEGHRQENTTRPQLDRAVAEAKGLVDETICRADCPRRADGRVCLFYNDDALANWNAPLFAEWARRRCIQGERLRPAFESVHPQGSGA